MIDCIAGYHLESLDVGIAKSNAILAKELEVPVVGLGLAGPRQIHASAAADQDVRVHGRGCEALASWVESNRAIRCACLHAFDGTPFEHRLLKAAAKVYCGNRELSHELAPSRAGHRRAVLSGTLLNSQPGPTVSDSGGAGTDTLTVNGGWAGDDYARTGTTGTRTSLRDGDVFGLESLAVNGSAAADTIDVTSNSVTTTVDGLGGGDATR